MMCCGVRHVSGMGGGRRWGTCFARLVEFRSSVVNHIIMVFYIHIESLITSLISWRLVLKIQYL
jgi:hypothetical protein